MLERFDMEHSELVNGGLELIRGVIVIMCNESYYDNMNYLRSMTESWERS